MCIQDNASKLSDNVSKLRAEIERAARLTGRSGADITLVAATKTQSAETVRAAILAGVDACGENRVQELTEKQAAGAYVGASVHFIGHLQTNKVRKVVGAVDLIQSVDSLSLLGAIDRVAGELQLVQDVLIQVNIGEDPDKFGVHAPELRKFLDQAVHNRNIRVRGLMTMLPLEADPAETRDLFARMYNVFVDIRREMYNNVAMDFLSMGMSGDFFDAISEGANMIRVGSTLFGNRE
ncbi:MAG: YggS family pyridoxal phosphate-dependent enzyme [Oscillospiraceae bacterium]|nr:YggS family pyridoxal phosphate-dependent enzyme [Oscillospiraceae bacterium]